MLITEADAWAIVRLVLTAQQEGRDHDIDWDLARRAGEAFDVPVPAPDDFKAQQAWWARYRDKDEGLARWLEEET